MNDRYTYGYGLGWNVENEYINESKSIMDEYNAQVKILDDIQSTRGRLIQSRESDITEEQIRQWYNDDYAANGSLKSYESYRADILAENEKRKNSISVDLTRNSDEYFANLYHLTEIKSETRKSIHKRKNELELLLSEKRIELSSINLGQRKLGVVHDEEGNVLNSEELKALNKSYDEVWLEIRKIEHALKLLDEMFALVEFTKEETDLMMRGLNPQQRKIYDGTIGKKQKKGDDTPKPKKEDVEDFEIDLSEYENALYEYEKLLEMYNEDLDRLYELQIAYEKGEIEYSEYEKFANYMVERYRFILELYKNLLDLKTKFESLITSKSEDLLKKLKELEDEFSSEYQHRTHLENGMEYHDDNYLVELQEKINKIKEELERRKNLLREPQKPEQPMMILEDEIEKEEEFEELDGITLDGIIRKVCGDEKFTDRQSSRYAASKIKLFSKPQKDNLGLAYKIVSIPRKVIGIIPKAAMKVYGLFVSKKTKQLFKGMEERANNLTDREVEILLNEYQGAIAQGKRLPRGFSDAIRPRVNLYVGQRVAQINEDIKNNLLKINYCAKVVKALNDKLKEENTPEMRKKIDEVMSKAYDSGATCVKDLISLQIEGNNLQNGNGLHSFEEELKALDTKLNYVGGRFSKSRTYDPELWSKISGYSQKIEYSLDPKEVLDSYLAREQIYKENTKEKRSLFNLGSKVTAGKLDYRPFVESLNYGNDPFIRDLITSVLVVSSTVSLINNITANIKNAQAIEKYNAELSKKVAEHNNAGSSQQELIDQIRSGGDTIEKGIKYDIRETEGAFENMAERGIDDKYDWVISGKNYRAEDTAHHLESSTLSTDNTSTILDLTNKYNSGQITHAELIRGVQDLKRHTTEVYEGNLAAMENYIEQYAQTHPHLDYTAVLSALRHAKANPLDSVEMTDFLASIYEKSLNVTDFQSLDVLEATIESQSLVPDILTLGATVAKVSQEEMDTRREIKPDSKKAKELKEMIEGLKSLKAELTDEDLKEIESLIQR